jgi:hypothetical protein
MWLSVENFFYCVAGVPILGVGTVIFLYGLQDVYLTGNCIFLEQGEYRPKETRQQVGYVRCLC